MLYDDSSACPHTADDYEAYVLARTDLPTAAAREILAAHGVKGRSKLSAHEARQAARRDYTDEAEEARQAAVVRYRWLVAHGLGLSYGELEEIERTAGVRPLKEPGSRGAYGSAADVRAVYAAAAAYQETAHAVRVRVTADTPADREAAQAIIDALSERYPCTEPDEYSARHGGTSWYFETRVPRA